MGGWEGGEHFLPHGWIHLEQKTTVLFAAILTGEPQMAATMWLGHLLCQLHHKAGKCHVTSQLSWLRSPHCTIQSGRAMDAMVSVPSYGDHCILCESRHPMGITASFGDHHILWGSLHSWESLHSWGILHPIGISVSLLYSKRKHPTSMLFVLFGNFNEVLLI